MVNLLKFGERLNEYIVENGLNASSFGKIINTNKTSVCEYVRGVHFPDTKIFYKIIEYFNCSADYLLGLTDFYPKEVNYCTPPPFGERFRFVLKDFNYSQYRLEKELKLSGSTVYGWLFKNSMPSVDSLINIAKHLGCSVDYLIGRES